jgi:hypothetical protein
MIHYLYMCGHGEGVGDSRLWEMGQLNFNMGPVWSEVRLMH